ncbi:peptidylprolyl isomerase [Thermodesulfobacteriota bacterium]
MKQKYFTGKWSCLSFYLLYTFFAAFPVIAKAESLEIVDRIVAVVNDEIILLSELNHELKPYEDQIKASGYPLDKQRTMLFKVREDILNNLVNQKLTDKEIEALDIKISEKEIDNTIERIKEDRLITDEELIDGLASEDMTMEEYREKIKEQILRSKLVNYQVKSKIVITKEDIEACYKRDIDKYSGETKYHLSNILMQVPPSASEAEKLEVNEKMESVLSRLNKGESFSDLANAYSESSSTADGGYLGLFKIDALLPQLQEAIKGMKAGEFTSILDTDQGYQIFYISEIVKIPGKSCEEATPEIETRLYDEVVNEKYAAWIEELRKKSHVKIIK